MVTLTKKILTRCVLSRFLLLLGFLLFSTCLYAGERLSVEEQIRLSKQGVEMLLARDYVTAEIFLKKLVTDWPDELIGYFGWMYYYQTRNLDNFDYRFDRPYRKWEKKGRQKALQISNDPKSNSWDLFLSGGTLGVSGFYRAHNSKMLAGFRDGSSALQVLEKSFEKDPSFIDPLYGTGLYHYWRSHFTRFLNFLPFLKDRREEGKEMLRQVVKRSRFSTDVAEIALAFIEFKEEAYQKVLIRTESFLRRYPRNTIVRMLQGDTYLAQKRYAQAIRDFERILAIDPTLTKSYLYLGLAHTAEEKNKILANTYLEKFLRLEPNAPRKWRKMANEKLGELE